jgi:hypothetical protein
MDVVEEATVLVVQAVAARVEPPMDVVTAVKGPGGGFDDAGVTPAS